MPRMDWQEVVDIVKQAVPNLTLMHDSHTSRGKNLTVWGKDMDAMQLIQLNLEQQTDGSYHLIGDIIPHS